MDASIAVQAEQCLRGTATDSMAVVIAAISALIAAASAVAAFISNHQNKKQYLESIQPQLSMSLVEFNSWLYLRIKNTGRSAAKNVLISLKAIKDNGGFDELIPDSLFKKNFELYPEETVQGKVALRGGNILHTSFPSVEIDVSYESDVYSRKYQYARTVTFLSAYTEKISADVNFDKGKIEDSLRCISRAAVRTANYLDGHQVGSLDELDILAGKSLENDLRKTLGQAKRPVMTRAKTIKKALKKRGK